MAVIALPDFFPVKSGEAILKNVCHSEQGFAQRGILNFGAHVYYMPHCSSLYARCPVVFLVKQNNTIMQCLNNYIGINWCGAQTPASNLYVNDLPGLSLKSIDKIANDEQATFVQVWEHVQKRALRMLSSAIMGGLNSRYQLNAVYQMFDLGKKTVLTVNQTAPASEKRGIEIALSTNASALQVIHVQQASLYLKASATFTLTVYDALGNLLNTYEVEGVQGWNTVNINQDYFDTEKVILVVETTSIDSPQLLIDEALGAECCTTCLEVCNGNAIVRGIKFADITDITYGNNSFGLSAAATVKCDYSNLVCKNKSLFTNTLWYLLGAEVLTERIHSDRLNRYTIIDAKKALELREEFYLQYKAELGIALNNIYLNTADSCLECNQPVTLQSNLP